MGFIRTDKSKVLWRSTNITKTTFKKRVAASVHFYPVLLVYIYSNQENVMQSSTKKKQKTQKYTCADTQTVLGKGTKADQWEKNSFLFRFVFLQQRALE